MSAARKKLTALIAGALPLLLACAFISACSSSPDTSAPERTVVNRTADWHGALLYVADQNGPDPDWGSVRIYDNVSGFVEKSVEQTLAAAPADVCVTPDGGSMFVASGDNGRIEHFHWDGNNWLDGPKIDTPAQSLSALVRGPDGMLYAAAADTTAPAESAARGGPGLFYRIDPASDSISGAPLSFPQLASASGIAWSPDGGTVYVSGKRKGAGAALVVAAWPSARQLALINLPAAAVNEAVAAPDGRFVYVMGRGKIVKIDAAARAVAGALTPAPEPDAEYYGAAFSADGRYLFTDATPPGADSTLYVIDVAGGNTVQTVRHIGVKARGLKRVE